MSELFEKLGTFYLGKEYDPELQEKKDDYILYDSKDLNTHAVIIGMTGSGKTGLGIGLLEEALIDNIPIIAIDPKGDLSNLLLTFPELRSEDFLPWVNAQEAMNRGESPGEYAAGQAELWRKGLASWGQEPSRIARLKSAADFTVYTPGSSAGIPVSVLRRFSPPDRKILDDGDLLSERIQTSVTGLLALLGIAADPISSREHILLSNILETIWSQGRSLDLPGLIQAIQKPPFSRIGVMDLDMFYPASDRFALAMRLNNLLAAPGFEAWLEGDPLDIGSMLFTPKGKPRASIFSISHLSDEARMFFVTMLLNEVLSWMRSQPGTSSLRAILYMDEIFGYFPPVKNPPSKAPLLTLLKQARAFGLGVVLSTQNPVDLDYKGLSNTGTWFIGRLQTERDKDRVLAGLEGVQSGEGFDRGRMESILSGLGKRVFLLHNVHESEPVIFQTRWVLSYLRGPMTRDQIKKLMAGRKVETADAADSRADVPAVKSAVPAPAGPPVLPSGIESWYLGASGSGQGLVYYPGLVGRVDVNYYSATHHVDLSRNMTHVVEFEDGPVVVDWDCCQAVNIDMDSITSDPLPGGEFQPIPAKAKLPASYRKWNKDYLRWVRQNNPLKLYKSRAAKLVSEPGESEAEFRVRVGQSIREDRDREAEKLRRKYGTRFTTLKDRLMRAEQAVSREQEQAKSVNLQTALSFGTAILGAFLGKKRISTGSISRMGSAFGRASRGRKEKMDVARALEKAESIRKQIAELQELMERDLEKIELKYDPSAIELEEIQVKAQSKNITGEFFGLVWLPYRRTAGGRISPDWQ